MRPVYSSTANHESTSVPAAKRAVAGARRNRSTPCRRCSSVTASTPPARRPRARMSVPLRMRRRVGSSRITQPPPQQRHPQQGDSDRPPASVGQEAEAEKDERPRQVVLLPDRQRPGVAEHDGNAGEVKLQPVAGVGHGGRRIDEDRVRVPPTRRLGHGDSDRSSRRSGAGARQLPSCRPSSPRLLPGTSRLSRSGHSPNARRRRRCVRRTGPGTGPPSPRTSSGRRSQSGRPRRWGRAPASKPPAVRP